MTWLYLNGKPRNASASSGPVIGCQLEKSFRTLEPYRPKNDLSAGKRVYQHLCHVMALTTQKYCCSFTLLNPRKQKMDSGKFQNIAGAIVTHALMTSGGHCSWFSKFEEFTSIFNILFLFAYSLKLYTYYIYLHIILKDTGTKNQTPLFFCYAELF